MPDASDAGAALRRHVEACPTCRESAMGYCSRGFALLRAAVNCHAVRDGRQLELLLPNQDRPFVRMAIRQATRAR